MKYTKEDFIRAAKESFSVAQLLQKISLVPRGGNYRTAQKKIQDWKVDTSHFTGQGHLKGKHHNWAKKSILEDILVEESKYKGGSYKLKIKLIQEGVFERKCYRCGNTSWEKQNIPLELDHINGNIYDNRLLNLTLLCPNCHALTPTYRGRNQKRRGINKSPCVNCGKIIRNNKTGWCEACWGYRNLHPPKKINFSELKINKDILKENLKNNSFKKICCENSINEKTFRRICKEENILIPNLRSKNSEAKQMAVEKLEKYRKFHINKEELEKLVRSQSILSIGKMFNVSDNAIRKRCRLFGINWRKKNELVAERNTHNAENVAPQGLEVQILSSSPKNTI